MEDKNEKRLKKEHAKAERYKAKAAARREKIRKKAERKSSANIVSKSAKGLNKSKKVNPTALGAG